MLFDIRKFLRSYVSIEQSYLRVCIVVAGAYGFQQLFRQLEDLLLPRYHTKKTEKKTKIRFASQIPTKHKRRAWKRKINPDK